MTRLASFSLILALVAAPFGWASPAGQWSWLARGVFFVFLAAFIIVGALTAWHERTQL